MGVMVLVREGKVQRWRELAAADVPAAAPAQQAAPASAPTLPAGVIVLWAGPVASIPAGWALCDGTNGTPDLRDKFVKGAAAGQNPGATGGAAAHTPSGTVSQPTLTMNSYTPAGANSAPAFTGSQGTVPAHTVGWPAAVPTFTGTQGAVPAQTISWPSGVPAFTGSALATHQHELPVQNVSGTVFRHVGTPFGTGTSRAAVGQATFTANTTAAAVALSEAKSAGTPAGTVAWPAGVPTNGPVNVTPAGTVAWPAGVPTMGTAAFTPAGTVAAPAFTGTPATLTGTVGQPVFTGASQNTEPAYYALCFIQKL